MKTASEVKYRHKNAIVLLGKFVNVPKRNLRPF